jgi:hypothetical protein
MPQGGFTGATKPLYGLFEDAYPLSEMPHLYAWKRWTSNSYENMWGSQALKMEEIDSSETLVSTDKSTRRYDPEDRQRQVNLSLCTTRKDVWGSRCKAPRILVAAKWLAFLFIVFGRLQAKISVRRPVILTEVFRGFPQSPRKMPL